MEVYIHAGPLTYHVQLLTTGPTLALLKIISLSIYLCLHKTITMTPILCHSPITGALLSCSVPHSLLCLARTEEQDALQRDSVVRVCWSGVSTL